LPEMSTLGIVVAANGIVASEEVFPKGGRHDKRQHLRVQRGSARSVSSSWEGGEGANARRIHPDHRLPP